MMLQARRGVAIKQRLIRTITTRRYRSSTSNRNGSSRLSSTSYVPIHCTLSHNTSSSFILGIERNIYCTGYFRKQEFHQTLSVIQSKKPLENAIEQSKKLNDKKSKIPSMNDVKDTVGHYAEKVADYIPVRSTSSQPKAQDTHRTVDSKEEVGKPNQDKDKKSGSVRPQEDDKQTGKEIESDKTEDKNSKDERPNVSNDDSNTEHKSQSTKPESVINNEKDSRKGFSVSNMTGKVGDIMKMVSDISILKSSDSKVDSESQETLESKKRSDDSAQFIQEEKDKNIKEKAEDMGNYIMSQLSPGLFLSGKKDSKVKKSAMPTSTNVQKLPQASVIETTKSLCHGIQYAKQNSSLRFRLEEFRKHMLLHPEAKGAALGENIIPVLLRLRSKRHQDLNELTNQALALVGHIEPLKGNGIRILSLDGGGIRGLYSMGVLREIERCTGKPVNELFDYVCGVSTGSLLATLFTLERIDREAGDEHYKSMAKELFQQSTFRGYGTLLTNHGFYSAETMERLLKKNVGETTLLETRKNVTNPKLAIISAFMHGGMIESHVFRNYEYPPMAGSRYPGTMDCSVWEAVRASSAAPGYFQDFAIGNLMHVERLCFPYVVDVRKRRIERECQFMFRNKMTPANKSPSTDGGMRVNNPTALAIEEARALWPNERIQCIVSIGTGLHLEPDKSPATPTRVSWGNTLVKLIKSATNAETVHCALQTVLPENMYFRFNPPMLEELDLDEIREEKLRQIRLDTEIYCRAAMPRIKQCSKKLLKKRLPGQRLGDVFRAQRDMRYGTYSDITK